ncbi:hypothetical protein [Massilia sp. BJB1822]|uniref:hypothetical protein n=1 Tax=Massilia sp. BJB1822 TaxID=2744470 RepID=UPI001593D5F4|nr:hypothetical protein [Massilia sp. BJB1822]NVE00698.1 hypothetical protein [Massilia sp. BJB1822]
MSAKLVYRFDYIAPKAEVAVFFHGLSDGFTSFSLRVFPGFGTGVSHPVGHVTLRQEEFYRHVDGTMARKLYVHNLAPLNSCAVDVLLFEVPAVH